MGTVLNIKKNAATNWTESFPTSRTVPHIHTKSGEKEKCNIDWHNHLPQLWNALLFRHGEKCSHNWKQAKPCEQELSSDTSILFPSLLEIAHVPDILSFVRHIYFITWRTGEKYEVNHYLQELFGDRFARS